MKRTKEDYPSFNLFSIVGTWESVNLNPTIIIYRSDKEYLLLYIYIYIYIGNHKTGFTRYL